MFNLALNIEFLSALSGLLGTVMLFFFGLPPTVNKDGHINLILEQIDEFESRKYKLFQKLSYFGLSLIAISFLLQLIHVVKNI